MTVSFDEFSLDVRISHRGAPFAFPTERPDKTELRSDPQAVVRLAGYLVRQYADNVNVTQDGETCFIDLHFNH